MPNDLSYRFDSDVLYLILNTIKEPSSLIRENIGNEANDDGASPS